ncbi:MAG: DinB family protein [Candidatus Rokuibacteriota bacterium]
MDALGLFMQRFDAVHGGFVDELFRGITDDQVRERPQGLNSVAWLVWHVSRVADAVVSGFVADRPQVLDADWSRRLRVERRDVGPGMTGDEVQTLSGRIDLAALRAYQRAVGERVKAVAAGLPPAAWDAVVPPEQVRRVVADQGLLLDAGKWVEEFWAAGHPRGWYLLQVGLLHPYGHWFDAMVTRGRLRGDRA